MVTNLNLNLFSKDHIENYNKHLIISNFYLIFYFSKEYHKLFDQIKKESEIKLKKEKTEK